MVTDDDYDPPTLRRVSAPPPTAQELARMCADLRLLKSAMTEQSLVLGTLTSQVARLAYRQDALQLEAAQDLAVCTCTGALDEVILRMNTMAAAIDAICLKLAECVAAD